LAQRPRRPRVPDEDHAGQDEEQQRVARDPRPRAGQHALRPEGDGEGEEETQEAVHTSGVAAGTVGDRPE